MPLVPMPQNTPATAAAYEADLPEGWSVARSTDDFYDGFYLIDNRGDLHPLVAEEREDALAEAWQLARALLALD